MSMKWQTGFSLDKVREDFPILSQQINNQDLVYLDSGASAQKPRQVIAATANLYSKNYANVHRGIHSLSQRATDLYENARCNIRDFINAESEEEIIFTSGTTGAINLLASSFVHGECQPDDEILISEIEHHSNILPWQLLASQTGIKLVVAPVTDAGELDWPAFEKLLGPRTRLVAMTHLSNAIGTVMPIADVVALAHERGAKVLIDGAQAIAHMAVDVRDLDCDFYAFSGHKLFGPSGIGVLYGKKGLLNALPPYQGGGEMIEKVSFDHVEFKPLPYKFEAGTPNIAGAVGLGAAVEYLSSIGLNHIERYEHDLLQYATEKLLEIDNVRIIGTAKNKAGLLTFVIEGVHAADLGTLLDQQGVAVRVGHHCAMPAMHRFGVSSTVRASFALYNTRQDVDRFISATHKALAMLT